MGNLELEDHFNEINGIHDGKNGIDIYIYTFVGYTPELRFSWEEVLGYAAFQTESKWAEGNNVNCAKHKRPKWQT